MTAAQYGAVLPIYTRGAMTTTKRVGLADYVSSGVITNTNITTLTYMTTKYDNKFICWDEMAEFRKPFKIQVYTDNSSNILQNISWGYVLPSALLGSGLEKAYMICYPNGTQRMFLLNLSGVLVNGYSLEIPKGAYYTFTTKILSGQIIPNVTMTATRFSPQFNAFVPIEQEITDSTGAATFYLEPFVLYKMVIVANGYAQMIVDFTPAGTTSITINLNANISNYTMPGYTSGNDATYQITPSSGLINYSVVPRFNIVAPSSNLVFANMYIYKIVNGTTTLFSNHTIYSPIGGSVHGSVIDPNITATYIVYASYQLGNLSIFYVPVVTYYVNPTSPMNNIRSAISGLLDGWTYYLVATFAALLAGGFVSRFTIKGAGLVAVGILWVFTLLNPNAVVVCITTDPVTKLCTFAITTMLATVLATVFAVLAYVGAEVL
jgi:hypothetical protein